MLRAAALQASSPDACRAAAQISGEEKPGITHPDSHIWRYFLCPLCLHSAPEIDPLRFSGIQREGVLLIVVGVIELLVVIDTIAEKAV